MDTIPHAWFFLENMTSMKVYEQGKSKANIGLPHCGFLQRGMATPAWRNASLSQKSTTGHDC